MKKSLLFSCLLALTMWSCGLLGGNDTLSVDYYPVQENVDGKWGMIDGNGEYLFADEFKSDPTPAVNGVFTVSESDGITVYKASKHPEAIAEGLVSAGLMNEGLMPVTKKNSRISIIDKSGNEVVTLSAVDGKEITMSQARFSNGLLVVQNEDHKMGAVNSNGEVAVDFKYEYINTFSDGLAVATKEGKEGKTKTVILNTKGEEVVDLKDGYHAWASSFTDGYLPVQDGEGSFRLMDKKGEYYKLPGKVKSVSEMGKKFFVFMGDDYKYGVMSLNDDNEVLIKPKYDYITIAGDGNLLVKDGDDYYLMNSNGDKLVSFDDDYSFIMPANASKFKFLGEEKQHWVLLDGEGKLLNKLEFSSVVTYISEPWVESDYFDVAGFTQAILSNITDNGMGQYSIGEPVSKLGLNVGSYVGKKRFDLYEMTVTGFHYYINFSGEASRPISGSSYDPWTRRYRYYFNDASTVAMLRLVAKPNGDVWNSVRPQLYNGLKEKGFKADKEEDAGAVFTKGDITLIVEGGENVTVTMGVMKVASVDDVLPANGKAIVDDNVDDFWL